MSLNRTFTGVVINANGGNAFTFSPAGAISVLANSTNESAAPTYVAATGRRQVLSTDTAGTGVTWVTPGTIDPGAPIYDVMAHPFNATGNGIADDTAAINAAIAAANTTPGTIYLGRAHRITAALNPITANNVVLCGRGRFNGGTHLRVDSATPIYAITLNAQYVGVRNMWIQGVQVGLSTAVYVNACFMAEVQDCLISQMGTAVEAFRSTHTDVRRVITDDLYGSRGFYAHGDGTAYNHAIRFESVFCGTNYPLPVTGVAGTWAAGQTISVGNLRFANGAIWQAATSGTTGATAPNGFPSTSTATVHTTTVSDGGVSWRFAMPFNAWFCQGSYSHTFEMLNCGALQGGYGVSAEDDAPGVGSTPLFLRMHNVQVDHPYARGVRLREGKATEITQLFITSVQEGYGMEVASTFGGGLRLVGGEIFGCAKACLLLSKGDAVIDSVQMAAGAAGYSTIEVTNSASNWKVMNCIAGATVDSPSPATNYGIDIGSGCDNYTVEGNTFRGHLVAPIRNTPGPAKTRVVRNNVPDEPNQSADGYEVVSLAPGTYSESEVKLQLLATTHTVFISVSSAGDVIITGFTQGGTAAGKQVNFVKDSATGRILFRDGNANTNAIWTPAGGDYGLSAYNDSVAFDSLAGRWRPRSVARLAVRKNSTGSDFSRRRLNFIEGNNVTLTIADDASNEETDITIASSFSGIRDNGAAENARNNLNFVSSVSNIATVTDDAGNNELEITYQRAALTGAVSASQNSNATAFSGIRDNGSLETAQPFLNFVAGTNTTATITQDAPNTEMEIRVNVDDYPLSGLADQAAHTFVGNITGSPGAPTANALSSLAGTSLTYNNAGVINFDGIPVLDDGAGAHPGALSLNFVSSASVVFTATDAGGGQANITATVVANLPDPTDIQPWQEQEVTTTGVIDNLARTTGDTGIVMFSGAAPVLNGLAVSTWPRGLPIWLQKQDTGTLDIIDNAASSTAQNRFAIHQDKNIRLKDDEFAGFVGMDISTGGTDSLRWACFTHRPPFCNTTTNMPGETLFHNGDSWQVYDYVFSEEFLSTNNAFLSGGLDSVGKYHWFSGTSDDGPTRGIASEASHYGIIELESGGTAASTCILSHGASGTEGTDYINSFSMADVQAVHFICRIPSDSSLTNTNYGVGLFADMEDADVQGGTPLWGNTGLVLHKTAANAAWLVRRATAGAQVGVASARNAVLGDWIECWGINQGGGTWSFVINGGTPFSVTGVATSGTVRPGIFLHQTSAGARSFHVDRIDVALKSATNRYTT